MILVEPNQRGPRVALIQILLNRAGSLPTLMKTQSIDHRVGGSGVRGWGRWIQHFKTEAYRESERLRDDKCGAGLKVQARTVSRSIFPKGSA